MCKTQLEGDFLKLRRLFPALAVLTLTMFFAHVESANAMPGLHLASQTAVASAALVDSRGQATASDSSEGGFRDRVRRAWEGIKRIAKKIIKAIRNHCGPHPAGAGCTGTFG